MSISTDETFEKQERKMKTINTIITVKAKAVANATTSGPGVGRGIGRLA